MSLTRTALSTGSSYVDDLLTSRQWDTSKVTFGFAGSSSIYGSGYGRGEEKQGFAPLNGSQQAAARDAMDMWSELIAIDIVSAPAADADIRLAVSGMPSTAWAYTPSSSAQGGDIWLGTSSYMASAMKGNYAYLTIMHEIGHALGLSHPHEKKMLLAGAEVPGELGEGLCPCCAGALHGQTYGVQSATSPYQSVNVVDAMAWSVMSYRSHTAADISQGYTNEKFGYAQTPMARDIAALQHLYGANYETRSTDTVYRWSETTGEKSINGVGQGKPGANKVFETVWDGGGRDTFDLSNHKGDLTIDLSPGGWTNFGSGQLANLGNGQKAPGNVAVAQLHQADVRALVENAIAGAGDDSVSGNAAGNVLIGGAGNDKLSGIAGNNILIGDAIGNELALVGLTRADVISVTIPAVGKAGNDILLGGVDNDILIPGFGKDIVKGGEGSDTLVIDLLLAELTMVESAAGAVMISYSGGSVEAVSIEFMAVRDGIFSLIGPLDELADRQYSDDIMLLYRAGLGRDIDSGGLNYWADTLENGSDLDQMALSLIKSAEFAERYGIPEEMDNETFVAVLYQNVLDRAAGDDEISYWSSELERGTDRAQILLEFSQSEENRASAILTPAMETGLDLVAITQTQWAQEWA